MDISPYPYIWCDNCMAIQPVILDTRPADHHNNHDALDLVCAQCKLIIATLHAGQDMPREQ